MSRLSPNAESWLDALDTRWPGLRRRSGPVALTLLIEIVLLLMLLSLGAGRGQDQPRGEIVTTFDAVADPSPEPAPESAPAASQAPAQPAAPSQAQPPSAIPSPLPIALPRTPTAPPVAPPVLPPKPDTNTAPPKIRAVIRSDMAGNRGPADTGARGGADSQRIAGSGPNGEPLYAAKWYREPTDDEFRGYFSRVSGPGWALINCRTEPEFRVDRCVLVDEWPDRSNMGSAVLAAAWQFRVRPPRVGGRSLVGEWVRIRIDYMINRE